MFPYFYYPLQNILMSWETFLLMSIATERFLAVCHPLVYRAHKVRHSPRVHMMTYIMPSVLLSFIIRYFYKVRKLDLSFIITVLLHPGKKFLPDCYLYFLLLSRPF